MTSSPKVELKCMSACYKHYLVLNYNRVCINNCALAIKLTIIIVSATSLKWHMALGEELALVKC